jgi:O-antigen/teichoic acid export membrane protein
MNADLATIAKEPGAFRRALLIYKTETGQPLGLWAFIALLNFIVQIVFRRELGPGEFGTLNTALGMIGLMTVPVLAVNLAFTHYLARRHADGQGTRIDSLRAAALPVTQTFAWIWGGVCLLLMILLAALLDLPRFSLELLTFANVLIALGGLVSLAVCQDRNQLRLWAWLLASSALARVLVGVGLAWQQPWAESALAAFLLAGFITLTPALDLRETGAAMRLKACQAAWDRDFLLCAAATFSVLLALFLFSSADRIVAQSWFGVATSSNMRYVDWPRFDAYQTAGLLGRGILWGTQPLLWILFAQRSRLVHTTAASLSYFWIYVGALLLGAILLGCLAQPLSRLFCGDDFQSTALFVPSFAASMVPLGLLQALGIFSLASRRYPECFVLGGCAVGYALLLYLVGRQPQLMPAYMFGGGVVSLMLVLLVGVVRWGRKQP